MEINIKYWNSSKTITINDAHVATIHKVGDGYKAELMTVEKDDRYQDEYRDDAFDFIDECVKDTIADVIKDFDEFPEDVRDKMEDLQDIYKVIITG